jgi:hypothetical protein
MLADAKYHKLVSIAISLDKKYYDFIANIQFYIRNYLPEKELPKIPP